MDDNKVIPLADYERITGELKGSLTNARTAYERLKKNPDIMELPQPKRVTVGWLTNFIGERIAAVKKSECFNSDMKEEFAGKWQKVGEKARPDFQTVEGFMLRYGEKCDYDEEHGLRYKDIHTLASSMAEIPVPEKCKDHLNLIGKLRLAVGELREWEKQNHVRKNRLEWLITASNEALEIAWAKGSILIDRAQESLKGDVSRYWREAAEQTFV